MRMTVLLQIITSIGLMLAAALPAMAADPVPPPPDDAVAAKVYGILDQHCARCHQFGKVAGGPPASGLGNILHLDQLARDPNLVRPANPDGSRLYTSLLMRLAPHDGEATSAAGVRADELTSAELDAMRSWIQGLPAAPACADRSAVTASADADSAKSALEALPGGEAKSQRFITLAPAYNTCASPDDLAVYRDAIGRTVNSLSWGLDPIALQPVNAEKTLLRLDLGSIGWDAARWDRLVAAYPFLHTGVDAAALTSATGTAVPIVRGDWLAATALRAPLYYDLLGLPDRLTVLLASLKINVAGDVDGGRALRYGVKSSAVARGARLMQRHEFANGPAWLTFEYAPTAGRQDVFDSPAGPTESGSQVRSAPKPDATLVQFALPSGFTAFYMANADGQRINDIAQSVLKDDTHPAQRIGAGASCFGCHAEGVRGADDQLRARLAADTQLTKEQRDKFLLLHATADAQQLRFRDDRESLSKALRAANLTPGLTRYGTDPVTALIGRYEQPVTRAELSDALGVDDAGLTALEATAKGGALDLLQRSRTGPVPRAAVTQNLATLYALSPGAGAEAATRTSVATAITQTRPDIIDIVLKTPKAAYRSGDLLTIQARTSSNCHLTIVNVDATGRGTVIFPNDFEQNNYIEAGRELHLPAETAPYQFRLKNKGRETIIGLCSTIQKAGDGIVHDFEKQRFTELGDYRAFLLRSFGAEPDDRRAASSARPADPKARRTRRGRIEPLAPPKDDKAGDVRDSLGRTAIQIEIN
jgi:mono/diheme cytochrome c family protein